MKLEDKERARANKCSWSLEAGEGKEMDFSLKPEDTLILNFWPLEL